MYFVTVGYRVGERGGLHLIQYLLFVLSWVKLFFINYIDVYNFFVLLFCFFTFYILRSLFVQMCIEMLHLHNIVHTFSPPNLGNESFLHFNE